MEQETVPSKWTDSANKTIQGLTVIVNVQHTKTQSFFLRFVPSKLNLFGFISEHYTE